MSTTRRQLRRSIGANFGERIDLTATNVGDTNTFFSQVDLTFADNELNGREAWYAESNTAESAINVGTRRVVQYNTQDTFSITVVPDWPAITRVGDVVELYNARGYSASITEIHDKINELIDEVSEEGGLTEASTPVAFSSLTPRVTIPANWYWLFGAEFDDRWGNWYQVFPADMVVREWDHEVTFKNYKTLGMMQNRNIRLIGSPKLTPLTRDSDETTVDAAWLVDQAVAELRRSIAMRWGDAATVVALSNIDLAEAEKRRPRAGGTFPNTGRRWKVG